MFKGCFICGAPDHFSRSDCPVGIDTREKRKIFFNEMWAHKPHTKKRLIYGAPVSTLTIYCLIRTNSIRCRGLLGHIMSPECIIMNNNFTAQDINCILSIRY